MSLDSSLAKSLVDLEKYSNLHITYVYEPEAGKKYTIIFGRRKIKFPGGGQVIYRDSEATTEGQMPQEKMLENTVERLKTVLPVHKFLSLISQEYPEGVADSKITTEKVQIGEDEEGDRLSISYELQREYSIKFQSQNKLTTFIKCSESEGRIAINDNGVLNNQAMSQALELFKPLIENPKLTQHLQKKYRKVIFDILQDIHYLKPEGVKEGENWRSGKITCESSDIIEYGFSEEVGYFISINGCAAILKDKKLHVEAKDAGVFYRRAKKLLEADVNGERIGELNTIKEEIQRAKTLEQQYSTIVSDILNNIDYLKPTDRREGEAESADMAKVKSQAPNTKKKKKSNPNNTVEEKVESADKKEKKDWDGEFKGQPCNIRYGVSEGGCPYIEGDNYRASLNKDSVNNDGKLVVVGGRVFYELDNQQSRAGVEAGVLTKMSNKIDEYKKYDEVASSILRDIKHLGVSEGKAKTFQGHPCDIKCGVDEDGPYIKAVDDSYIARLKKDEGGEIGLVVKGDRKLFVKQDLDYDGSEHNLQKLTIDTICDTIDRSKKSKARGQSLLVAGVVAAAGVLVWAMQTRVYSNVARYLSGSGDQDQGRGL